MSKERDEFIRRVLGKMTLEEKAGQCFTFSWRSSILTPAIIETIERLHAGGLRVEPYTTESARAQYYGKTLREKHYEKPPGYFDIAETHFTAKHPGPYIRPDEYARRLNRLKEIAFKRPCGVPLHVALDYEGAIVNDYQHGGLSGFPAQMGLAATGDTELVYQAGKAIARQLSAIGVTMIHSPVCDVNTNPDNPEINFRAFSGDSQEAAQYCVCFARGLREGGLVPTAKHFPGRGAAESDAHHDLEVIPLDKGRLHSVELAPYKELIKEGLPGAVLCAHSVYPAYEKDLPGSLSRRVITGLLREELGFEGVITTDALGMGAIINKWGVPRACVMALKAGANLLLVKSDDAVKAQSFFQVKQAAEDGELSEDQLNDSVRRVLAMKYDQGLFENGGLADPEKTGKTAADEGIKFTARDAAERSLILLRDRAGLLPLKREQKVMVIEQVKPVEFITNDIHCHAHIFNEAMAGKSRNIINADCQFIAPAEEISYLIEAANGADIVAATNFYWRHFGRANNALIKALIASGKKVVVVTNTPYEAGIPKEAETALCTFSAMPESLRAAAGFLYGEIEAKGRMPFKDIPPHLA